MLQGILALAARLLLAAIFLVSAYRMVLTPSATIAQMAKVGVPYTNVSYGLAILIEFGAGLLLVLGAHTRLAALTLAVFLVPFTYYHYGIAAGPSEILSLLRNAAILGGLLHVAAFGAGSFSLDRR